MALKDEFTENGLTEEEQAIIDAQENDEEESNEEVNPDEKPVEEQSDDEQSDDEQSTETEKDEESDEAEPDEVEQEEPEDSKPFVPQYDTGGDDLANITSQVEEINTHINELKTQLEDGDLTIEEFINERDKLADQKTELVAKKSIYENNIRSNQLTQDQLWEHDQQVFFERKENEKFRDNPAFFGALDANVKAIANEESSVGKTGNWILNEAKRRVMESFAISEKAEDKKPDRIKPGKKDIPVTLASIPAAEENETVNNEFSYIDKLIEKGDVRGMEVALSKLTAEQQERYLSQTSA